MRDIFSGTVLLSGFVSALVSAAITYWATWQIDKRNKMWALQAELKRYDVSYLTAAVQGLRDAFFGAVTEMEYQSLALHDIEREYSLGKNDVQILAQNGAGPESQSMLLKNEARFAIKRDEANIRYNAKVSAIEARAKALVYSLEHTIIPKALFVQLRDHVGELTRSVTDNAASVDERIAFFYSKYPRISSLLEQLNSIARQEIIHSLNKPEVRRDA